MRGVNKEEIVKTNRFLDNLHAPAGIEVSAPVAQFASGQLKRGKIGNLVYGTEKNIIDTMNVERHKKLTVALERIMHTLITQYQPEKVILFGSMAEGTVGEWSDIDLG